MQVMVTRENKKIRGQVNDKMMSSTEKLKVKKVPWSGHSPRDKFRPRFS